MAKATGHEIILYFSITLVYETKR